MTREEIIQVCDLYAQGINELSKLTSQEGHSEELSELLSTMLKSKEDGFNYTHNWIKQYVLNNSQINDNGKELLYVAQKTAERTKKEVINRACEWLENNVNNYIIIDDYLGKVQPKISSSMFDNFKKAMEE